MSRIKLDKLVSVGDKFKRLTAVEFVKEDYIEGKCKTCSNGKRLRKFFIWKFRCDCGNTIEANVYSVRCGGISSCGCMKKESSAATGHLNRSDYGETTKKCLLGKYISSAKIRNISFELNEAEFYWLTSQNCSYCNSGLLGVIKSDCENGDYKYNGIDRVDSKVGYIFSNCVPCCKFCNTAKKDYDVEEFKSWLNNIIFKKFE